MATTKTTSRRTQDGIAPRQKLARQAHAALCVQPMHSELELELARCGYAHWRCIPVPFVSRSCVSALALGVDYWASSERSALYRRVCVATAVGRSVWDRLPIEIVRHLCLVAGRHGPACACVSCATYHPVHSDTK